MAVSITRTADPASVAPTAAADDIATFTAISIGAAAADRIIVVCFTEEQALLAPIDVTIDSGGGALSMTPGPAITFASMITSMWYKLVPSGTTATFVVHWTTGEGTPASTYHITVYSVNGALLTPAATGTNSSTDMDVTAPLTTGAITIPSSGGFLGVVAGAIDTVAKTWANATADLDNDVGTYRETVAISTTGGSVTVTCTGGSNGEDGVLAWMTWNPSQVPNFFPFFG